MGQLATRLVLCNADWRTWLGRQAFRAWLWDAGEREAGTYITWSKDLQRHVPCTWPGSMVSPPPLAPWPPLLAPTGGF